MKLLITRDRNGGDWQVWAGLEGSDPSSDSFGFVIGSGETKDAALMDAEDALNAARAKVRSDLIEETRCIEERDLFERQAVDHTR